MPFTAVDEVVVDPGHARVYEHGWQSWSPTTTYAATATSARPERGWQQVMRFRPETPAPEAGFQAEGLLVVDPGNGEAVRVYSAADPEVDVPSLRARLAGDHLAVSANGPVRSVEAAGDMGAALAGYGDRASAARAQPLRPAPTVWCTWYQYFLDVTPDDVIENLRAFDEHDLPVEVVQIDDGWQAGIGDWLEPSDRFDSLADLAARIRDTGRRPGIWVAPFLAGDRSELARKNPEWLLGDAGANWEQQLFGLDLTHPGVRDYLATAFGRLRGLGFDYFKLDFVYAGALPGRRHEDVSPVTAYRSGLELVREAVGEQSYLLGCGAPMLPSVGLVDAMRVSPDTYNPTDIDDGENPLRGRLCIESRAWQHGRLWVNDADCLIVRPAFERRAEWAGLVERYGGLRSSSDRIADLDDWGLGTTRRILSTTPPPVPFDALPDNLPDTPVR
ncbi:MAG TPA: glycoside hydrolase family 36 protein [Nocardioidaceae bacterium]|nr:glycoside hydrolase family 36 protein [Nocardioidaceae bacterium]